MNVIQIRWKACGAVALMYLGMVLVFLILDHMGIQPIEPAQPKLSEESPRNPLRRTSQNPNWFSRDMIANPETRPRYKYSHGRQGVKYVIGVPTVARPRRHYVLKMVKGLIQNMSSKQQNDSLIVIFVGETNLTFVEALVGLLEYSHPLHMQAGLVDVIAPPVEYYPDFLSLKITLQDDPERSHWRAKQNLDYMFLMSYARRKGAFYLQLEDDVVANDGFLEYIQRFAALHSHFQLANQPDWIVMSFCDLGFIGKLFPAAGVRSFVSYVQLFYNDQPIDWLLHSFVALQSCRWESISGPKCQEELELRFIRSSQSQFQHMGQVSSLPQKVQKRKDKCFNRDIGKQRMPHLRQPFNLVSSHRKRLLRQHKDLEPGETFIWMYLPQRSKMLHQLMQEKYSGHQIRIRNGKDSDRTLPELEVEVVEGIPILKKNSSDTKGCGFLLSYSMSDKPGSFSYMLYYIREEYEGLTWFRNFFWDSGRSAI
nr:alpha-1,3-mannosyl-glycoprotein 4-beta-N-acetylglucosaminyltransferase A [Drosophila bipectinata]